MRWKEKHEQDYGSTTYTAVRRADAGQVTVEAAKKDEGRTTAVCSVTEQTLHTTAAVGVSGAAARGAGYQTG